MLHAKNYYNRTMFHGAIKIKVPHIFENTVTCKASLGYLCEYQDRYGMLV